MSHASSLQQLKNIHKDRTNITNTNPNSKNPLHSKPSSNKTFTLSSSASLNMKQDFQRLMELCNSYGLNEQETNQLIEEFKNGNYNGGNEKLTTSNDNDMSLNESIENQSYDDSLSSLCHEQGEESISMISVGNDNSYGQKNTLRDNEFSKDVYHHYQESNKQQQEPKLRPNYQSSQQNSSINEMTFNHNIDDEQHNYQNHHAISESKGSEMMERSDQSLSREEQEKKPQENFSGIMIRQNSRNSISVKQSNCDNNIDNEEKRSNNDHLRFKKGNYRQNQMQSNPSGIEYPMRSQLSEDSQEESLRRIEKGHCYHQKSIKSLKTYNHENRDQEYEKLIHKISVLEKQNNFYKQNWEQSQNQQSVCQQKLQILQNEYQHLRKCLKQQEEIKISLIQSKQKDTEIISGLKDAIVSLTDMLKQKEMNNQELQGRLMHFCMIEEDRLQGESLKKDSRATVGSTNMAADGKNVYNRCGSSSNIDTRQNIVNSSNLCSSSNTYFMQQQRQGSKKYLRTETETAIYEKEPKTGYNDEENNQSHPLRQIFVSNNHFQGKSSMSSSDRNKSKSTVGLMQGKCNNINRKEINNVPNNHRKSNGNHQNEKPAATATVVGTSTSYAENFNREKKKSGKVDISKYKGMIEELRKNYAR